MKTQSRFAERSHSALLYKVWWTWGMQKQSDLRKVWVGRGLTDYQVLILLPWTGAPCTRPGKNNYIIIYFEEHFEVVVVTGRVINLNIKKIFILWCQDYSNTGWKNLLLSKINLVQNKQCGGFGVITIKSKHQLHNCTSTMGICPAERLKNIIPFIWGTKHNYTKS